MRLVNTFLYSAYRSGHVESGISGMPPAVNTVTRVAVAICFSSGVSKHRNGPKRTGMVIFFVHARHAVASVYSLGDQIFALSDTLARCCDLLLFSRASFKSVKGASRENLPFGILSTLILLLLVIWLFCNVIFMPWMVKMFVLWLISQR